MPEVTGRRIPGNRILLGFDGGCSACSDLAWWIEEQLCVDRLDPDRQPQLLGAQYTHGNYGYDRCNSSYYTNDMYAIDYPLAFGDVVFSPFRRDNVTFAGRNYSHKPTAFSWSSRPTTANT